MKSPIEVIIVVICAILALWFLPFEKEVNNELISPIPGVAEESSPTPTSAPKPGFSYHQGRASWYGQEYCDENDTTCTTASGEKFDDTVFTCACAYYFQIGSSLQVTYQGNNTVVARCNDRGDFDLCLREPENPKCSDPIFKEAHSRILDLSKASFEALAPLSKGVIWVEVRVEVVD